MSKREKRDRNIVLPRLPSAMNRTIDVDMGCRSESMGDCHMFI